MKFRATTSERDAQPKRPTATRTDGVENKRLRHPHLVIVAIIVAGFLLVTGGQASAQSEVLEYNSTLFGGLGLRQATAVAVSPDDRFVYALSEQDEAIALFRRDITTGTLTYLATYVNGENNVTGLELPTALTISDDGANLYAVGVMPNLISRELHGTVVVFKRNIADGTLTYVETIVNGVDDVTDMFAPDAVSVSPDGLNVYVAGDNALTVFRRDDTDDGKLSFVESETGEGLPGSFQLRDVIVPDNETVYVTANLVNGIAVLTRDAGDMGKVSVKQTIVDGSEGVNGLLGAEKLAASPDGNSLYATGSVSGSVAIFDRADDGKISFVEAVFDGEDGVDGIGGAQALEISADGQSLYVAGAGENAFAGFSRSASGELQFIQCFSAESDDTSCTTDTMGLLSPSGIAVSTDGDSLYVVARGSDSISHYSRDSGTGQLTFQTILNDSDGGVPGLIGAFDVALSSDGEHAYVASGRAQSLVVFERVTNADGTLAFVERQENGAAGVTNMSNPTSVAVSPDGKHVYATSRGVPRPNDGSLIVFSRDATSGKLVFVESLLNSEGGITGIAGAWEVTLSPDGENVYVTGAAFGTIAVFSRDSNSGKLSQIQLQANNVSSVTGLAGASGISVSKDGKHAYVAGSINDSLVVFRRDEQGKLTWVETLVNDENAISGLDGVIAVDVSPDGGNVYAASAVDGEVTVFSRDTSSGRLSFVGGLSSAATVSAEEALLQVFIRYTALSVSPDGKYVFAVRQTITDRDYDPVGNIVTFARQESSGLLSLEQVLRNDEGNIRGLRTPTSIAVSDDGENVYVTSERDSAILTFVVKGGAVYTDRDFLPYVSRE